MLTFPPAINLKKKGISKEMKELGQYQQAFNLMLDF